MTTIDLITGILGAGKTTFIRKYATDLLAQGKKIAILENDFGAVNVDRMMLQDLQSDRCKVEMISGCNDPTCPFHSIPQTSLTRASRTAVWNTSCRKKSRQKSSRTPSFS